MRTAPDTDLARFQDDFARALFDPDGAPPCGIAALCAQPGFAVYRNTVMTGCIDALAANFPAVARLVGAEWFRAAAAVYVRQHPPALASLLLYGETFPAFLSGFEPAAGLPYLPGVARLDRCWSAAHVAATRLPLAAEAVAALAPAALAQTALQPHPAARWAWFAEAPCYTIWARNRGEARGGVGVEDAEIDWCAEGALLTRPADVVIWRAVGAGYCAFLDACAAGEPLPGAAQAALAADPDTDLATMLATLLESGAFCAASRLEP